jgi:D-lactate dehydrogenase (cytochrome)
VKKRSSSLESTSQPVSPSENPLYLIYFGVSMWAAVVGYGAYFYFSSSGDDSGPRTTPSGPPRKDSTSDLKHAISDLRRAFPDADRVLTNSGVLETYGLPKYTMYIGSEDAHPHGVVVFPLSTGDVVTIVNIARKWGVPIVPVGNGTSLEGHTAGVG